MAEIIRRSTIAGSTSPPSSGEAVAPRIPFDPETNLETSRGIDFRHLWHTLVERLWILVLCTLAGVFLALGYLARTPKMYQGHIVLEVDVAEQSVVASEDMPN